MATVLAFLVPATVFAFLWWLLRDGVLVACAVPATLAFGEAVFIPTWMWSVSLPGLPFALGWEDVMFIALLGAWLYVREKRTRYRRFEMGLDTAILWLLVAFVCLEIILSWVADGAIKEGVPFAAREWFYLPLSAFIWADILRRLDRSEVSRFIAALAAVSIPLVALYCLSSVGVRIYPFIAYGFSVGSVQVVRDQLTFPFWAPICLAWFATRPKQTIQSVVAIGLVLAACVLSAFRTYMLAALLVLVLGVVLPSLASRSWARAARRIGAMVLIAVASLSLAAVLTHGNVGYGLTRLGGLLTKGAKATNVDARLNAIDAATSAAARVDPVFGAGFSLRGASELSTEAFQKAFTWDVLWAFLVANLGWAGVGLFAALMLVFLASSLRLAWRVSGPGARLGLVAFLAMTWILVRSFSSFELLGFYPVSYGFVLALIMVERRRARTATEEHRSGLGQRRRRAVEPAELVGPIRASEVERQK